MTTKLVRVVVETGESMGTARSDESTSEHECPVVVDVESGKVGGGTSDNLSIG